MTGPLLTVEELAARWQRSPVWVRRAAGAERIPAVKIGGLWRFNPDEIERYENRHRTADPLSMTPGSMARRRTTAF